MSVILPTAGFIRLICSVLTLFVKKKRD